jgi:peptidoglycan/LPS O-acetylase OafA/YrhL
MNVDSELGQPWDGTLYNWTSVVFRLSASLALLGFAPRFAEMRVGPFLAALGRYSLPIYLIHPVILRLLGGVRVTGALERLPAPALWTILIVTAVSYGIAWLLSVMRLDFVLFGQPLPRRVPPEVRPAAPV